VTDPHTDRVAVVTPWYPSPQQPFAGAFVQAMVDATAPGTTMTVYHCEEWAHRRPPAEAADIESAYDRLLAVTHRPPRAVPTVGGARLVRVPVPLSVGLGYAAIARRHEAVLRAALDGTPIDAPVVHAHVGLPGGWAALHNAAPGARVVVTEHATFLDQVLAQDEARVMYDRLLDGCAGLYAVGAAVSAPLLEAFPHHAGKIGTLPNPVSFGTVRDTPVTALRRWLFVGGLTARKGVTWLLEAFARCHADDPALTLTFVGDGELRRPLAARADELGVTGAVTFAGIRPPKEALALMREHDLLVHPSRFETFGMTVVEAVAAGLPVLVTRCGGPQETLAGLESAAGELIDVEEGSDALVAGYRRLRDRFPHGVDLVRARHELAARYGYPATAAAHRRVWSPSPRTADV
jgi:glycogen synthase